jgi:hypothetical protein
MYLSVSKILVAWYATTSMQLVVLCMIMVCHRHTSLWYATSNINVIQKNNTIFYMNHLYTKYLYTLRPILLFTYTDVSITKMCLDTSVLTKSNMCRREYVLSLHPLKTSQYNNDVYKSLQPCVKVAVIVDTAIAGRVKVTVMSATQPRVKVGVVIAAAPCQGRDPHCRSPMSRSVLLPP